MPQNIFHVAGEDIAQIVQRGGGDVPVLFEGVQGAAAEGIVLDQRIGRDALAPHGFPQRVVFDHRNHLSCDFHYICAAPS